MPLVRTEFKKKKRQNPNPLRLFVSEYIES